MNDTEKDRRIKRLKYRANHRGIKEMDIILGRFANDRLDTLNEDEIDTFEALMEEHDRDLLIWFTGEAEFPHVNLKPIFDCIGEYLKQSARDG